MALTDAMVALYSTTLAAATSSVSILAIPTTGYRDLRLVVNTTGVNNDIAVTFNGDSGANYSRIYMAGQSSGAVSATSINSTNILFGYIANTDWSIAILDVMDAFAVDKHKATLSRSAAGSALVMGIAGRWASNAAVSSMTISAVSNSFAVGTTFELFGIKA